MQPPLSGQIQLGSHAFENLSPRERAREISIVTTEAPTVGTMDAYTLVALGRHPYSNWFGSLRDDDHQKIEAALRSVGAETLAYRQVAELSDGERQKISIARALAQDTHIILLDEPTAFLDLPRKVELMHSLRDLAHRRGLAILLSTHDLDLALRFADQLWVLSAQGELSQGYPEVIAMTDTLGRIFESATLHWDSRTGDFKPTTKKVDLPDSGSK